MSQNKTCIFGFQSCDASAAQSWLEEMYAKGWTLTKLRVGFMGLSLAQFRPRSEEIHYCVDVATSSYRSFDKRDEYLALCADAGWELIGALGGLFVFRSAPGSHPPPIHTDLPLEGRRFWKEAFFPGLITGIVCATLFALVFAAVFTEVPLYRIFLLDRLWIWCSLILVSLVLTLLTGAAGWIHSFRLWRALTGGDPPPKSDARKIRARSGVMALATQLIFVSGLIFQLVSLNDNLNSVYRSPYLGGAPLLTWEELGESGLDATGRATESFFLRSVSSDQPAVSPEVPTPSLHIEAFDCRFGWMADVVLNGLLRAADFTPANLGFDEAYTAREGDEHYLILRQGATAALLRGPVDFTAPEVLALLREEVST